MSRSTKRQAVYGSCHRNPKGRKQIRIACEDDVPPRKGAIPPDAWEDLPRDKQAGLIWHLAIKLKRKDKLSYDEVYEKLRNKFKASELQYVINRLKRCHW